MLALGWLASWAHGLVAMNQPLTTGYGCVAASMLLWLIWAWRHARAMVPMSAAPMRLHWVGYPHAESEIKIQSPWLTEQGQPVHVRVLLDAGSHLLLHVVSVNTAKRGGISAFCLVDDHALPGPWRWRVLAGQPRSVRTQS